MRRVFSDLRPGDPVFTSDGRERGTVSYATPTDIWLDLGFAAPTCINGENLKRSMVRLGSLSIFTNKDRNL